MTPVLPKERPRIYFLFTRHSHSYSATNDPSIEARFTNHILKVQHEKFKAQNPLL